MNRTPVGLSRPSTSFRIHGTKNVDARDKPGHDETSNDDVGYSAPYAVAMSGKTASILVFSVAALNGLTM